MIESASHSSREIPDDGIALGVLDFGEVWESRWLHIAPLPDSPARAPVMTEHRAQRTGLLIVTVPQDCLNESQVGCVREWIRKGADLIFTASIEPGQLEEEDREIPGYILLRDEISRHFNREVIMIPQLPQLEHSFVTQMMKAVLALSDARKNLRLTVRDELLANRESHEACGFVGASLDTLPELLLSLMEVQRAEALLPLLTLLQSSRNQAQSLRSESEDVLSRLVLETAKACRLAATKAPAMFGRFAEHIVREVSETGDHVRRRLESREWGLCSIEQLSAWRDRTLKEFESSGITLPLVGRYSSGKTTLLNHLLGSTPKGHKLLRTAKAHNTALLARFHFCDAGQQRVEFSYREALFELPLCRLGTSEELTVDAPCDGRITQIVREENSEIVVVITRASDGASEVLRMGTSSRLHPNVRVGLNVRDRDPIATGVSRPELRKRALSSPEVIVTIEAPLIQHVRELLATKKLIHPRFDVLFRDRTRSGFELRESVFDETDVNSLSRWMEELAEIRADGMHRRNNEHKDLEPIEILFSATVDPDPCIHKHPLEAEEDWDWFQGPPASQEDDRESRTSGPEQKGFAEGSDAELLIQRADIYLNGPLFRLLNIVDTPGLNSVTPMHTATTEEFINRGNAFLILLKLENAATDRSTRKLFDMIRIALLAKNIPSAEHKDHIFIALNRFVRGKDESALTHIASLQKLANASFDQPVTLYVIDLKEQSSPDQLTEQLLGSPSLAPFFRAIRRYVAKRGIADKLTVCRNDLEQSWEQAMKRLQQDREDLDGHSVESTLRTIQATRPALTRAIAEASIYAEERITHVQQAVNEVNLLFSSLNNKQSYLSAQSDISLTAYNKARSDLSHIPSHTVRLLTRAVKDAIEPPPFSDLAPSLDVIPMLSPYLLADEIDQVVRSWPGLFRGLDRWLDRLFDDGEVARHGAVEKKRLRNGYFSDFTQQAIQSTLDALKSTFKGNLRAFENEALDRLQTRIDSLKPQQEDQAQREQAWQVRSLDLIAFQPVYQRASDELEQHRANIQRILEREPGPWNRTHLNVSSLSNS